MLGSRPSFISVLWRVFLCLALGFAWQPAPSLAARPVFPDPNTFTTATANLTIGGTYHFGTDPASCNGAACPAGVEVHVDYNGTNLTVYAFNTLTVTPGSIVDYTGNHALALVSKHDIVASGATLKADAVGLHGATNTLPAQGPGYGQTAANGGGGGGASFGALGGRGGDGSTSNSGGLNGLTYGLAGLSAS